MRHALGIRCEDALEELVETSAKLARQIQRDGVYKIEPVDKQARAIEHFDALSQREAAFQGVCTKDASRLHQRLRYDRGLPIQLAPLLVGNQIGAVTQMKEIVGHRDFRQAGARSLSAAGSPNPVGDEVANTPSEH